MCSTSYLGFMSVCGVNLLSLECVLCSLPHHFHMVCSSTSDRVDIAHIAQLVICLPHIGTYCGVRQNLLLDSGQQRGGVSPCSRNQEALFVHRLIPSKTPLFWKNPAVIVFALGE